jgi:hypothetical protein
VKKWFGEKERFKKEVSLKEFSKKIVSIYEIWNE